MTLIAQTIHHGSPFIVGDIVFSSEEGNLDIPYPTSITSLTESVQHLRLKPHDYWQKIYILTTNLCIGLAGNEAEMTEFLKEIRLQCRYYNPLTFENLLEILGRYDMENMFTKSAFIACHLTPIGEEWDVKTVTYPKGAWDKQNTLLFDWITVVGSGQDDFLASAKEIGSFQAQAPEGSVERAISANLSNLAYLLTKEVKTGDNRKTFWGAGFETIFFNGNAWEKFDQIAYVIMFSELNEQGDVLLPQPRIVFHYRYYKEVLFYSCIRIDDFYKEENSDSVSFISKVGFNNLYVVPPLDYAATVIEAPESYSFQTERVAYGFSINTGDNKSFHPASYAEGGVIYVSHEEGVSTTVTLGKQFLSALNRNVRNVIG